MEDGLALAAVSDILQLHPVPSDLLSSFVRPTDLALALAFLRTLKGETSSSMFDEAPPRVYVAEYHCRGLIAEGQSVRPADHFAVAIRFPETYLRFKPQTHEILSWLGPHNTFHPNIRFPFVCVGPIQTGTPLSDLLYQIYEIITYRKSNPREGDALNSEACVWARHHQSRLPLDGRPLKRRKMAFSIQVTEVEGGANASVQENPREKWRG
ncbi:MAG: hypothetical protein ACE5JX_06830 [Acidobacteriota bacterium]